MKWAVLSTWRMSYEGCRKAAEILKQQGSCGDAAVAGVCDVEDNPAFHSVGYSGLPDCTGRVTLDAGFMDGCTLHFGAVASLEGFRSPAAIARSLKDQEFNNFLVGDGAAAYARAHGFETRNNLTPESQRRYQKAAAEKGRLSSYHGHDTVCFTVLDSSGNLCAATSTSGLFLKEAGRVGDTPLPGCGFYADSLIGSAAATGVGEEIMKGALSYAAIRNLQQGKSAMAAATDAVCDLSESLRRRNGTCNSISLICLDHNGSYGIGTNVKFAFCYASDSQPPAVYIAQPEGSSVRIQLADAMNSDVD